MFNIQNIIITLPAILLAMTVHEFGHAYVAYKLGDSTAKVYGRLTLNPFSHVDIFGLFTMMFVGFGWAKPVPINPNNFKHYTRDTAIVSAAGAVFNVILAAICLLIVRIIAPLGLAFVPAIISFLNITASLNVGFAVFNLLPIPPLDGSKIFIPMLPHKARNIIYKNEQFIQFGLMALLFLTDILDPVLIYLRQFILNILTTVIF